VLIEHQRIRRFVSMRQNRENDNADTRQDGSHGRESAEHSASDRPAHRASVFDSVLSGRLIVSRLWADASIGVLRLNARCRHRSPRRATLQHAVHIDMLRKWAPFLSTYRPRGTGSPRVAETRATIALEKGPARINGGATTVRRTVKLKGDLGLFFILCSPHRFFIKQRK
jgi:hypothetical protein